MSLYQTFRKHLDDEIPIAVATIVSGPAGVGQKMLVHVDGTAEGTISPPELACRISGDAMRLLRNEQTDTISYELPDGARAVFVEVYPAPPRLVIVGASHAAAPLTRLASALGY